MLPAPAALQPLNLPIWATLKPAANALLGLTSFALSLLLVFRWVLPPPTAAAAADAAAMAAAAHPGRTATFHILDAVRSACPPP